MGELSECEVTLKDLARLLNLSQTTVSRALNGYPEVGAATRRRVLEAAEATGYRPNRTAQRLATGRAGSIGFVMPTGDPHHTDLHLAEFLSGLSQVAVLNDVQLVISPSRREEEAVTFKRLAASGSVDALFLSYIRRNDPRVPLLKALPVPAIVHGRHVGGKPAYPFVDIDNEGAFLNATRLLLQLGHRRIALLNGPEDMAYAIRRHIGMGRALKDHGLVPDEGLCRHAPMTEEGGYRGMMQVLDQAEPPTAVLCSSMLLALGATRAINERGLAVARDVSIIAHDDVFPYLKPENFSTPLTTITSSIRAAGARIAERLIAAAAGCPCGPEQEVWSADLIVRASTGPVPSRRRKATLSPGPGAPMRRDVHNRMRS